MDIKVDHKTVVVFDLDDTIYNELDYLRSAYKEIAMQIDQNKWMHVYSKMFSFYRSGINVFQQIATEYNLEIESLIAMYREHQPDIYLFEGVREIMEAIKAKNGKIGLITDGRSSTQRAKIRSLGISSYLDGLVISEEIGTEKPDLANFRTIETSIIGNDYYYIADNLKKDFIAPNALGWKTIGVIDNGKNIHFQSHNFMKIKNLPQNFIFEINEIKIL